MANFVHYATEDEGIEIMRDVVRACALRLIPNHPVLRSPKAKTYDALTPSAARERGAVWVGKQTKLLLDRGRVQIA